MFNNFVRKSCRLWDNVEKFGTSEQARRQCNKAHAHCMLATQATNTYSEYVILIAFPLQQSLPERHSMLHYAYSASLVNSVPGKVCKRSWLVYSLLRPKAAIFQLNMYHPAAIQTDNSTSFLPFPLWWRTCKYFGTTLCEVEKLGSLT